MQSILNRFQNHPRRFLALAVLAWLNLLVPPCLAEAAPMPADMEHCDHGVPDHQAHCAAMQAADCETAGDLNAESFRGGDAVGKGTLLALLPPEPPPHSRPDLGPDPGGGPVPLHIRFCSLRN